MSDADRDAPTVTVTGGAGYVGSRVVADLADAHPDWTVRALDDFSRGTVHRVGDVEVDRVDVRDDGAVRSALSGADAVVNLAAVADVEACERDPVRAHAVNAAGAATVADHCRATGAALVHASSMAVVGDPVEFPVDADHPRAPLNRYGRTKLLAERAVETYAAGGGGVPAVAFLKANVYGGHAVGDRRVSKGSVVDLFVDDALAGDPLSVYEPGTQARNYVHVADVGRAYVRAVEAVLRRRRAGETGAEVLPLGGDEDPDVTTVARTVRRVVREELGREPTVERVPNPREETLVDSFPVDTTRTRSVLDWAPRVDVEAGVREAVRARADR